MTLNDFSMAMSILITPLRVPLVSRPSDVLYGATIMVTMLETRLYIGH
jgi:hypothetical protein